MFRSNGIIEIHKDGAWVPAAEFRHVEGHRAFFEYLPEFRFSDNPLPVSLAYPVADDPAGVTEDGAPTCPAFMYDLVPQVSQGRGYLLEDIGRRLLLPNFWMRLHDESLDFLLAQCGALNPVGNLRLNSAVNFWREQGYDQIRHPEGFTRQEILKLNEEFAEEVGALNSGITCLQGASQKFLITENHEGVLFPDAILDDSEAALHWLVKMTRSWKKTHSDILRMESIYFSIARDCGIRTHGECYTEKDMLFIERFDRIVEDGRVIRLHQESLLSVAGIPGFQCSVSLFTLANAIARHATDPARELAEFIKRDLLNQAMGNTDNHGRNTAMQLLPDGTVQLTPLYDFAPMFLDPDGIPRACKWIKDGREVVSIAEIVEHIDTTDDVRHDVMRHLGGFCDVLEGLPHIMRENGLDAPVIELLHHKIESAKSTLSV